MFFRNLLSPRYKERHFLPTGEAVLRKVCTKTINVLLQFKYVDLCYSRSPSVHKTAFSMAM